MEIGLDAYPDKKLSGSVIRVANVGEQRPNSDAKVFQVDVEIKATDPTLRPAMTTSNKIRVSVVDSALFVPLESLHNHADSVTYVFKKDGMKSVKQEVVIGLTNANDAVILSGLAAGERVYVSIPSGMEDESINLLPEMQGKRRKEKEEPAITEPPMGQMQKPMGKPSDQLKNTGDQKEEGKEKGKGERKRSKKDSTAVSTN